MTQAEQIFKRAVAAADRGEQLRQKAVAEERDLTKEELGIVQTAFDEYRNLKAQAEMIQEADRIKAEQEEIIAHPLFGEAKNALKPSEQKTVIELPPGSFSEQKAFRAFISGGVDGVDSELRKGLMLESKAFGETSEVVGGVMVSEQMANFIIEKRAQINVLRQRCTVIPVQTASFTVPSFVDETDPSAIPEAATVSELTAAGFGKTTLIPGKHSMLWKISEELLEDAPAIERFLQTHFANRSAIYEEGLILNGVGGSANPLGLLNATFTATSDISGATDDIAPEDFLDAKTDLTPAYRRGAVFICPNLTIKAIYKFRSIEGGVGTGTFMFQPSFQLGAPDQIAGQALLECGGFADPSSDGDAMFLFGDLSTYFLAERVGITVQRLMELYAATGHIGFRLRWRWDGTPSDENAFARYNRN